MRHSGVILTLSQPVSVGSLVRPKVVKSVHFCPSTGNFMAREYRDITSNMGLPTGAVYPTRVITSFSHFSVYFVFHHGGLSLKRISLLG